MSHLHKQDAVGNIVNMSVSDCLTLLVGMIRAILKLSYKSCSQTCFVFSVQVKSYLAGTPAISLALNDNLAIGRREGGSSSQYGGGYGSDVVMLDDCNFHESVSLDRFDSERTLELKPPDGEFALMNYR